MLIQRFSEVKAESLFASYKKDIETIRTLLDSLSLWLPSYTSKILCDKSHELIDDIQNRLDQKLIITIIGPCGSGKSTLFNTLIGQNNISPSGISRPTTKRVTAVCKNRDDAHFLTNQLASDELIIHSDFSANILEHAILIDTPDTDSTQQDEHIPLVNKIIGLSDILICLFDGENPKRKDHIDFLSPFVKQFAGSSLVVTLNKCDRQDENELKSHIIPDFHTHIENAWQQPIHHLLCISARSHLNNPDWDEGVLPKHQFDQFNQLKDLIENTFNQSHYSISKRIENAKKVKTFLHKEIRLPAKKYEKQLREILEQIEKTEIEALGSAVNTLKENPQKEALGYNVQLYQRLTEHWVGPMGWVIALWNRLLMFGSGFAFLFRFGNPIRQIIGMLSSFKRFKTVQNAVETLREGDHIKMAIKNYRLTLEQKWPDIAEALIRCDFDETIRETSHIGHHKERIGKEMADIWRETMDEKLSEHVSRLSRTAYQLIFNIPAIAILGYVGWVTTSTFLYGRILSGDFFLHAFITTMIILLLSFFIFQWIVKLTVNKKKISKAIFENVRKKIFSHASMADQPIHQQIKQILQITNSLNQME